MEYVPDPYSSNLFKKSPPSKSYREVLERFIEKGLLESRPLPIRFKRTRSKRQGASRKGVVMYERDVKCRGLKDSFFKSDFGFHKQRRKYSKRSRRLFKQGF